VNELGVGWGANIQNGPFAGKRDRRMDDLRDYISKADKDGE